MRLTQLVSPRTSATSAQTPDESLSTGSKSREFIWQPRRKKQSLGGHLVETESQYNVFYLSALSSAYLEICIWICLNTCGGGAKGGVPRAQRDELSEDPSFQDVTPKRFRLFADTKVSQRNESAFTTDPMNRSSEQAPPARRRPDTGCPCRGYLERRPAVSYR